MRYKVRYKRMNPDAKPPMKAHQSDAGWDLTCSSTHVEKVTQINAHGRDRWRDEISMHVCSCGLAFDFSEVGYALLFPRSSVYKTGLVLSNGVGVIDAGYRGEVMAKFYTPGDLMGRYAKGDRFAQLIVPTLKIGDELEFIEVEDLDGSDRGEGGFGSSGE